MFGPQWWISSSAREMLRLLGKDASPRKLRLFACACCRYVCTFLPEPEDSLNALDIAEHYADRQTTLTEFRKVESAMLSIAESLENHPIVSKIALAVRAATWTASPWYVAWEAVGSCTAALYEQAYRSREADSLEKAQGLFADLLRDCFGHLYWGVKEEPHWTETYACARDLAQEIYWQRAFDRLPVLGDALLQAGCANEAMLSHCSAALPHAKGCWLVDLLLGNK
jgi:hypothetical protein